jgi:hypothetical protein
MKVKSLPLILMMLVGVLVVAQPVHAVSSAYTGHMVFIVGENHPLADVTCSGCAPYMMTLGNQYANSTNYPGSVDNNWKPSLPNYLGLFSGEIWGCTGTDPAPNTGGCTTGPWTCTNPCNLVDRFSAAGITWKGYMEGMPNANICNGGGSYDYTPTFYEAHHDPFPYFGDIASNSTRCTQVVQSGSSGGATSCGQSVTTAVVSNLLSDLNTSSPPNFAWVTPNELDDGHPPDCTVSQFSMWLSVVVPSILSTSAFTSDPTATIVITFDEPTNGTYGVTPIYFVVVGPGARLHYSSSTKYTHLNLIATVEKNWKMNCLVSGNDCGATVMSEFFSAAGPKLGVTTAAQTLTAGVCSGTITVQTQDSFGNPTTVGADVGLSTSSKGGALYSTNACTTVITSVTIVAGSSSASFFYKDSKAGSSIITASATGLTSATQTETVNAAAPSKLAFTTAAQTINAGACSAVMSVQTQDTFGNPTTAGATVGLATTSPGGTFSLSSTCTPIVTSVTIAAGSSSGSLFYKDTVVGGSTITASASGLTSATQVENIVPAGPVKLVFTSAVQALTAGVCSSTMTVQSQNSANTPTDVVANAVANLSTNSSSGTFYSDSSCTTTVTTVIIAGGTDSVSFFYKDTAAGSPSITASSSPLTPATQTETVKASQSSGLQATFTDSPNNPQPGQSISFAAMATGGGSPYVFKWDFGDGSSGTGQTISHLYQRAGSYTTELTVTDAIGHLATASHVLTVAATSPSSPGGICLQCLVRTLSLSSLFLIGLAIGLALTAAMMALAIRRNRRTIRRLVRQRDASGYSLRHLGTLDKISSLVISGLVFDLGLFRHC